MKIRTYREPSFLLVFITAFLIIVFRNSFEELRSPALYLEDGMDLFPIFYNDHRLSDVFRFYANYISVLPNLLAFFLTLLPLKWIPVSFVLVSHGISALTYSLFYKLVESVYGNKWLACYVAIIIALLPLGNLYLVGSLMFQNWNFVIILYLLVLMPAPQGRATGVLWHLLVQLLIWSNPASLLIFPLCVYRIIKNQQDRIHYALFAGSTMIYYFAGIEHQGINLSAVGYIFTVFAERVVTESIVGTFHRSNMIGMSLGLVFLPVMVTMAALFYFSWKQTSDRGKETVVFLVYFLAFSTLLPLLGRKMGQYFSVEDFVTGIWHHRYLYIPKVLFVSIFLLSACHYLEKYRLFRPLHFVFIGFCLYINLSSGFLYDSRVQEGRSLAEFLDRVAVARSQCASDNASPGKYMVLERGNWDVKIKTC